jgi:hypothetical protein
MSRSATINLMIPIPLKNGRSFIMTEVNSMNNDNPDFGQPVPPTKAEIKRAKKALKKLKAANKRERTISEMSKKYVGRDVRAPLADHPTSWHVGSVMGVDVDVNDRVILLINHAKYGPLRLLEKKVLLQ